MTGRSVAEWVGDNPDTAIPPRIRLRVFEAKHGRCHACTRKVLTGEAWTCEHVIALINGGENRERNLDITCCNCLAPKNAADVAEKSLIYRKRSKHLGLDKPKQPFPGSIESGWKKPMHGPAVRR